MLYERGADVESSLHAYFQSFSILWDEVGSGGDLVRRGPYLYY